MKKSTRSTIIRLRRLKREERPNKYEQPPSKWLVEVIQPEVPINLQKLIQGKTYIPRMNKTKEKYKGTLPSSKLHDNDKDETYLDDSKSENESKVQKIKTRRSRLNRNRIKKGDRWEELTILKEPPPRREVQQ